MIISAQTQSSLEIQHKEIPVIILESIGSYIQREECITRTYYSDHINGQQNIFHLICIKKTQNLFSCLHTHTCIIVMRANPFCCLPWPLLCMQPSCGAIFRRYLSSFNFYKIRYYKQACNKYNPETQILAILKSELLKVLSLLKLFNQLM